MEEKSISLTQYKLMLACLKYIPFIMAIASLIAACLGCIGISVGFIAATCQ